MVDSINLHGLDEVLAALEMTTHNLPVSGLDRLNNFNNAYLVITRNVRNELRKNSFQYPEFLQRFDARFAHYYFRALQDHLANDTAPHAWRRAFAANDLASTSPLICMALGVNAHINNDIPQVLADCSASAKHYPDFLRVNDVINDSIYEVIDTLQSSTSPFSPQRRFIRPVYKLGMKQLTRLWRANAWQKYLQLRDGSLKVYDIEQAALRNSNLLAKLPI